MKIVFKYGLFALLLLLVVFAGINVNAETATATLEETSSILENKVTEVAEIEIPIIEEKVESEVAPTVETTPITKTVVTKAVIKETPKVVKVIDEKIVVKTPEPIKAETPKPIGIPATAPVQSKETTTAVKKEEVVKTEIKTTTPEPVIKNIPTPKEVIKATPAAFSHAAWNQLAQKHISSTGKVNYKGFKADLPAFEAYLKSLADNRISDSAPRAAKMAYWINAYNAFTIKLIVDNYPVSSITKLHGGKPWDVKWIKLGGKTYSLNNIEHDILRPQFKDARIHFAVNCAAQSCPPVWNKAWTAQNLNGQLERSAKDFINNAKYNSVGGNEAAISKIFEWYAVDFGDSIIDYLNKYTTTKVNAGTTVSYKDYNWALNE